MRSEAPVYNYDRPTELVSSNGFSVEYAPIVTDDEIRDDIISYLGEYRFALQKYDYDLLLTGQNGILKLTDPHRREPMVEKGKRALAEKQMRDEATHREVAELKGLISLEDQLQNAEIGDSVLWFSPPGPKEEGYGDYGFIFKGDVMSDSVYQKRLKMTAIRVERPVIEQYNHASSLLIGSDTVTKNADEFLATPGIVKGGIANEHIDSIIASTFDYDDDPEQKERFQRAISKINNLIEEFVKYGRHLPINERIKAFHAIENLVVEIRKGEESGEIVIYEKALDLSLASTLYGHTPENNGGGSCPKKSNNPFSNGIRKINNLLDFDNSNKECSDCSQSSADNHYHCPGCNKKFSDETQKSAKDRTKECGCGFKFGC